jgi:hypothetical protein
MSSLDPQLDPVWWSKPWWKDPRCADESALALDEIERRISALQAMFSEEWTAQALRVTPNAIIPILYHGVPALFECLMWIGGIAASVGGAIGVSRPVSELIGEDTYSALFELETASWFAALGWEIEFLARRKNDKTPDIRLTKNELQVAVECKKLRPDE